MSFVQARVLSIAATLALLAAAGCGDGGGGTGPASEPSQTATAAATPARRALTIRDDGRTVVVGLDTQVSLILEDRYRWSTPEATGAAVDVQEVVSDAPTGSQTWELGLSEPGTAHIETTGSPACRPTTPGCPTADRRYVVTLDIRA